MAENYFNGGLVFDKQTGQRITNQAATLLDTAGAQQATYDQAGAAVQVVTDNDGFFQPFTADIKRGFLVFGAGFRYEVISSTVLDQADQAYATATVAAQTATAAKAAADNAVQPTRAIKTGIGISGGGSLDTDVAIGLAEGASPVIPRSVTSGSLTDITWPGWAEILHTDTPTGTKGYVVVVAAAGVLMQRFQGDGSDRTIFERTRIGSTWSGWSRSNPQAIVASRGLTASQSIPSVTSTQVLWTKINSGDSGLIPYAPAQWTVPFSAAIASPPRSPIPS